MAEAWAVEGDDAEVAFAGWLVEADALRAAAGPAVEEEDWSAVGVAVFAPCDAAVEGGEDAEAAVWVVGDGRLALHGKESGLGQFFAREFFDGEFFL